LAVRRSHLTIAAFASIFLTTRFRNPVSSGRAAARILQRSVAMPETRFCARCGEVIPSRRVEILPDTRLCVPCSEEVGGDYILISQAENLAKSGSLKKNYGDYKLARRRRHIERKEG
jgi:DksA/TraR C4-type zinc finger protein